MVQYALEQRIFLYDTYMKHDLLEGVGENFVMKEFPTDEQFTIW
jgi:hypothetical protein